MLEYREDILTLGLRKRDAMARQGVGVLLVGRVSFPDVRVQGNPNDPIGIGENTGPGCKTSIKSL